MRLLLDTHALIWWFLGDERLPLRARKIMNSNDAEVFVSAVSAYEIALKHRLGKLPAGGLLLTDFRRLIAAQSFLPLAVSIEHALAAGALDVAHRDPFDRLLVAQSIVEGMRLVSNEMLLDKLGAARLW